MKMFAIGCFEPKGCIVRHSRLQIFTLIGPFYKIGLFCNFRDDRKNKWLLVRGFIVSMCFDLFY